MNDSSATRPRAVDFVHAKAVPVGFCNSDCIADKPTLCEAFSVPRDHHDDINDDVSASLFTRQGEPHEGCRGECKTVEYEGQW